MLSLLSEVAGFSEPEFRGSEKIEMAGNNYASGRKNRHQPHRSRGAHRR
jgi:hypothetical protein